MRSAFARLSVIVLLAVSSLSVAQPVAQSKPPQAGSAKLGSSQDESNGLPVRRVVLYKNGVGYFEHEGQVRAGEQQINIHFTSAQLNDVLKSLTIVDGGQGHVTGVRYDSVAPLSERLKSLRLPLDGENTSGATFLAALRGARVEVRNPSATAVGRVLSVETEKRPSKEGPAADATVLSLITDAGEFRRFDIGPGTAVRILDHELGQDVSRYLTLLNSERATDLRQLVISTEGAARAMQVSYISEVPVWKCTYRIILPEKAGEKALLQGWAIVDNTVGEDWNNVQLSLVAGAPQSFVAQVSQPTYVRRPVVQLPGSALLTPQSHEGTMEQATSDTGAMQLAPQARDVGPGVGGGISGGVYRPNASGISGTVTDPSGAVVPGTEITVRSLATGATYTARANANGQYHLAVPSGIYDMTFKNPGFSTARMTRVEVSGGLRRVNTQLQVGAAMQEVVVEAPPPTDANFEQSFQPEASSETLGDLFRYDLKQRITIGKDQSALVPILQARVDAEDVTLWNANDQAPLRALWLNNTSGATLDAGTFNIIQGGAFAGEGLMNLVKPAERRLISYAADTGVRVSSSYSSDPMPITAVKIAKGVMHIRREERITRTYTIRNSDPEPRAVIIEHPTRPNWKLAADLKAEETTANFHRFRVRVAADSSEKLDVRESRLNEETTYLSNATSEQIALWLKNGVLSGSTAEAFHQVLSKRAEIASLDEQVTATDAQVSAISADQARVRENMKALKGTAEEKQLLQRYARQLNSQEDQLDELRKKMAGLKEQQAKLQDELGTMLNNISFDGEPTSPAK